MHPALLMVLVTVVAVLASMATWWVLRGSPSVDPSAIRPESELSTREKRIAAAALQAAAERTEGEAAALHEAGFSAAREALQNAQEMRELAERLDPPQIEPGRSPGR